VGRGGEGRGWGGITISQALSIDTVVVVGVVVGISVISSTLTKESGERIGSTKEAAPRLPCVLLRTITEGTQSTRKRRKAACNQWLKLVRG